MTEQGRMTEFRLEILTGVLLGLAALATAWAAFQASIWDGEELEGYTKASVKTSEAGDLLAQADRTVLEDELLTLQWALAIGRGESGLADFIREELMSDRLARLVAAWEEEPKESRGDLFGEASQIYNLRALEDGRRSTAEAVRSVSDGRDAGRKGDRYNLIVVLLAASLFVAGISSTFEVDRIRVWALIIGAAMLAGAVVWMTTMPVKLS